MSSDYPYTGGVQGSDYVLFISSSACCWQHLPRTDPYKQRLVGTVRGSHYMAAAMLISSAGIADTLEKVQVTSESVTQTGDVVASETTGFSSIISSDTLDRPGTTLAQTLAREAGVQIRQSGGLGAYSSASLRGSSADQVLVYLDGLLLNSASSGGIDLSEIDLIQAKSVEIYRGTTPVQFSQASLGGAINIRSNASTSQPSYKLLAGSGSFGSWQAGASANTHSGEYRGLFSAQIRSTDNDFEFLNDNGTHLNSTDDFNDKRNNAEVDQASLLFKLGRATSVNKTQDAILQFFQKDQQLPDTRNSAFNNTSLDTRNLQFQFVQRVNATGVNKLNRKLSIQLSGAEETYADLKSSIGLGQQYNKHSSDSLGLTGYWELVNETNTIALSTELNQQHYRDEDLLNVLPDSKASRSSLNLAFQQSLFLNQDKLLIAPALRFQLLADDFKVAKVNGIERQEFDHSKLTPQLGLKYQWAEKLHLHANIGQYQRQPAFQELFGDRGFFVGNADLKPEQGINFDMGLNWQPDQIINNIENTNIRLAIFHNDIDDAISRIYNARGIGKSINIPGATVQGMEWDIRSTFARQFNFQLKGTLQQATNRDVIPAFNGKQLPGLAEQSVSFYLDYRLPELNLFYEFIGRYNRFYDTANLIPAADQETHSLGLSYQYKRIAAKLTLDNLSNKNYEDFNGFPRPGRAIFFTLSFSGDIKQ